MCSVKNGNELHYILLPIMETSTKPIALCGMKKVFKKKSQNKLRPDISANVRRIYFLLLIDTMDYSMGDTWKSKPEFLAI